MALIIMPWVIDDDVHYTVSGGRGVFLSLTSGRYFALTKSVDASLQRQLTSAGETILGPNITTILPFGATASLRAVKIDIPIAFDVLTAGRAYLGLAARAMLGELIARHDLHRTPLSALSLGDEVPSEGPDSIRSSLADVVTSVGLLDKLRSTRDRCLPQSIALVRLCRGLGLPATLVIGVIARPFSAHAWVQSGNIVLRDERERIQQYSVIAAR